MLPKKANYVRDLVAKYPNHPARALAKIAYEARPEDFQNLESARQSIRHVLGVQGKKSRVVKDKTLHRKPREAGWSDVIPEALVQINDWKAIIIEGPAKALVLSDIHIPFHATAPLKLALQYGIDHHADLIILNGDIMDHYGTSDFEKDPRQRDFPAEVRAGKHFLCGLRKRFPHSQIVMKLGNHEERYERYLRMKAPDLLGIPDFEWGSVFGLKEFDIQLVKDKRPIRLGKLNVLHGHEHPMGISSPVNPARGLFLRAKCHALCGHWHQFSSHSEPNVEQKLVSTWSTGCLCDLHPAWKPINQWGHGFAFVTVEKDSSFRVENFRIIDGRIW